jgi:DNA polymerase-1
MKLLLIDGMSLLFRAYHAIKGTFTAPDGSPTNALYGFSRLAFGLFDKEKPDLVAVCIDRPDKTFRHHKDELYKANRPTPPDDMMKQIVMFEEFLDAIGFTVLSSPGFEADDVIATVASRESEKGHQVLISSSDRDVLQLVSDRITVMLNKKGVSEMEKVDRTRLEAEYRLTPEQFVWFKALKGDTSDNYGGVPGIGEKGAFEIASKAHNVSDVESTPKVAANLEAFRHSLVLATLETNAPLEYKTENLIWNPDSQKALAMLKRLGFTSMVGRFREKTQKSEEAKPATVSTTTASEIISKVKGRFALHFAPGQLEIADENGTYRIDVGSGLFQTAETTISELKPLLESNQPKVVSNLKSLLEKTNVTNPVDDIALMAHLDDSMRSGYDIESLKNSYLDSCPTDACAMLEICDILLPKIESQNLGNLYRKVELPLSRLLRMIENRGIMIDKKVLSELAIQLGKEIESKSEQVYQDVGIRFNIGSPKQLSEILFKKLQIEPQKKTKTGFSTSAAVLDNLRGEFPIVDLILDVRELSKLKNTYVDVLPSFADSKGRIHCTFLQMATSTGRLASTNPNLQSIPVRSELGSEIRRAFIAKPDHVIISADYSQIELRILAHLSNDPELVRAFNAGEDIHTVTAKKIFDTEDVTGEQRRRAKVINFGLLYGMSAHRLSNEFKISFAEADKFVKNYFDRFAGVAQYIKNVIEQAKKIGYTETILGRRRHFPELKSDNFQVRSAGERAAINSPIQGSAADVIKLAMLQLERNLEGTGACQILQVHDELLVECPRDSAEKICKIIKDTMENVYPAKVPLTVEAKYGANWLEAK